MTSRRTRQPNRSLKRVKDLPARALKADRARNVKGGILIGLLLPAVQKVRG